MALIKCPECGAKIPEGAKRCPRCGTPIASANTKKQLAEQKGNIDGHEWVDLGLPSGTKWATCNIGANSPEEQGFLFAWGETKPRNGETEEYSYKSEPDILPAEADAAAVNWGHWRIPTKEQLTELKNLCKWERVSNGFKVIGPNENYIFMPNSNSYWSSSISIKYRSVGVENRNSACILRVNSNTSHIDSEYRYALLSIRPVFNLRGGTPTTYNEYYYYGALLEEEKQEMNSPVAPPKPVTSIEEVHTPEQPKVKEPLVNLEKTDTEKRTGKPLRTCKECGCEIPESATFCHECGYPVQTMQAEKIKSDEQPKTEGNSSETTNNTKPQKSKVTDAQPSSKNHKGLWVGLGIVAFLAVIISVLLIVFVPSDDENDKQAKVEEPKIVDIDYDFVQVSGGSFTMGATYEQGNESDFFPQELPTHRVTVSDFYIGKYEVTQAQWEKIMGDNPSYLRGNNMPVVNVSWNDVNKFISELNRLSGKKYRLPTEAEWEFAARGGNKSRGYRYSGSDYLDEVAWYKDNASGNLHNVGQKKANELGIYDMSGNVLEWCSDIYGEYSSYPQTNPTGSSSGNERVRRGGGWDSDTTYCRISNRYGRGVDASGKGLGFRLAMDVEGTEKSKQLSSNRDESTVTESLTEKTYGNFIDSRDGNEYKTVTIGSQMWMAENLRYMPSINNPQDGSLHSPRYYVYGNYNTDVTLVENNSDYSRYGVMYNKSAAESVCPDGWHLPSENEWQKLEYSLGMSHDDCDKTGWRGEAEGSKIASNKNLWSDGNLNSSSEFSSTDFNALPGGFRSNDGKYYFKTEGVAFWTSTKHNENLAYGRYLDYKKSSIFKGNYTPENGFYVRCVKD